MSRSAGRVLKHLCFVGTLTVLVLPTGAYDRYSINGDATNCRFCHGDFRANTYVSPADGQSWGNLHNLHRFDMLNGDCDTCHQAASNLPVFTNDSAGGEGLLSIGCVGCHGRAEDGIATDTEGYGIAIQRRHEAANVGVDQNGLTCFNCHPAAAATTPVGENVLPPYYANPGINHPSMPTDPCNPNGSENFAGLAVGLDNDGDLVADQADPECGGPTVSPGESSGPTLDPLLVTGTSGATISISYGVACGSTDHRIHFGPLAQVGSYGYSGTQCDILATGTYDWTPPSGDSLFFVVVGNGDTFEGAYGPGGPGGGERPASGVVSSCSLPQDLPNRCDP